MRLTSALLWDTVGRAGFPEAPSVGQASGAEGVGGSVMTGLAETARGWVQSMTGLGPEAQNNLLFSLLTVVLLYGFRRLVLRVVERRVDDPKVQYQWAKSSSYVALILSLSGCGDDLVGGASIPRDLPGAPERRRRHRPEGRCGQFGGVGLHPLAPAVSVG